MRSTERQAEKDSISKIDEYRKKEKHVFRNIEALRRFESDAPLPDYNEQEDKLLTAISVLSSELLEIEVKLQNALTTSTASFIGIVTAIIGDMKGISEKLFGDVVIETQGFNEKLKEQCIAEKDSLVVRIEAGEENEQVLQEYPEEAHEFIVDVMVTEDKEMLPDILNHFKETMDTKIGEIDSNITRNLTNDWTETQTKISNDQHARNRNIIMEIIGVIDKFKIQVKKRFEEWRTEDENDQI